MAQIEGLSDRAHRRAILYHVTTPEAALKIIAEGFRDLADNHASGVWVSTAPLSFNEGCKGDTVLRLKVPFDLVKIQDYEVVEKGKPYREWCVPAGLLNGRCTIIVQEWGFMSLRARDLSRAAIMRLAAAVRKQKIKANEIELTVLGPVVRGLQAEGMDLRQIAMRMHVAPKTIQRVLAAR